MEKRETLSGPAAREGEVVEKMICETCSAETLENMKIGREGKGKSRAVARSAADMDQIRAGAPRPCLSCYGLSAQ